MKHASSIWQEHPGIHTVELSKLSPMSARKDNRWYWRDLPKMMDDGMWYPLLYYKVTPEWWNTKFKGWFGSSESWPGINPPVVCEDGMIWALKTGSNRLKCLKFMGYTSADAILFDDVNTLLKLGEQLREKDPLHGGKHGRNI
jgi:hypothetical protein